MLCRRCDKERGTDFRAKRRICRQCELKASREHYRRNREYYADKNKEFRQRNPDYFDARKRRLREIANEARAVPCADCGIQYPVVAMDFDHVLPVGKRDTVAQLCNQGLSEQTLREEIAKCEVRCSNCHRIRHHGEAVAPIWFKELAA